MDDQQVPQPDRSYQPLAGSKPETIPYQGTLNIRQSPTYPTTPQPLPAAPRAPEPAENLPKPYIPGQAPPPPPVAEPVMGAAGRPLFGADPAPFPTQIGKTKRFSAKPLMIAVVALITLSAMSVGAYLGVVVPNKPENQLMRAFQNTLQEPYITAQSTVEISSEENSSAKAQVVVKRDQQKKQAAAELKITISGVIVPVEGRFVDSNAYLKFGDITNLVTFFASDLPSEATPLIQSVAKKLSNQWIEFDSTLLKDAGAVACPEVLNLKDEDFAFMEDAYKDNRFIDQIKKRGENLGGKSTQKIEVTIDNAKAAAFSETLQNLPSIRTAAECQTDARRDNTTGGDSEIDAEAKPNGKSSLTVWIDQSTKRIAQAQTSTSEQGTKTNAKITFNYDKVSIEKPDKSTPFLNYLVDLKALVGAEPGVLGENTDRLLPN